MKMNGFQDITEQVFWSDLIELNSHARIVKLIRGTARVIKIELEAETLAQANSAS